MCEIHNLFDEISFIQPWFIHVYRSHKLCYCDVSMQIRMLRQICRDETCSGYKHSLLPFSKWRYIQIIGMSRLQFTVMTLFITPCIAIVTAPKTQPRCSKTLLRLLSLWLWFLIHHDCGSSVASCFNCGLTATRLPLHPLPVAPLCEFLSTCGDMRLSFQTHTKIHLPAPNPSPKISDRKCEVVICLLMDSLATYL